MQPVLKRLLAVVVSELKRAGWELSWHEAGPRAHYRHSVRFRADCRQRWINVGSQSRSWSKFHRTIRVERLEDVNDAFIAELRCFLDTAQEVTHQLLDDTDEEQGSG